MLRGVSSTSVRGRCLCGAIAFSVAPPYRWFAHCHCSMCRKHHGSLFTTSLGVARAAFRWLEGADEIVHYRATAAFERPFCGRCGASVPAVSHDERYWHVPAGLLDGDVGATPRAHIFAASRSPLFELDTVLPRHAAYPPGIALPVVTTARTHEPSAGVAGSCLCGTIAFAATVVPRVVVNCYCSLCRRSRAAAFSSTLPVPREAFRWIRGADRVRNYTSAANTEPIWSRHYTTDFCADCGSLAPSSPDDHATAMLPAGAIDTPLTRLPAAHLHVGSKVIWYEINDAWPQFVELPPAERLTELFQ
jgi:hypothetical protein